MLAGKEEVLVLTEQAQPQAPAAASGHEERPDAHGHHDHICRHQAYSIMWTDEGLQRKKASAWVSQQAYETWEGSKDRGKDGLLLIVGCVSPNTTMCVMWKEHWNHRHTRLN